MTGSQNRKNKYKSNYKKTSCLFITLFLISNLAPCLLAQESGFTSTKRFENILESIASGTGQAIDYSSLLDRLQEMENHPINVNDASPEELQKLFMLTDFQILSLQEYIRKKGAILTPYELSYVYGFDEEVVRQVLPFITLKPSKNELGSPIKKPFKNGKVQLFYRAQRILELQDGYRSLPDSVLKEHPNSVYQGNPWRIYTRYAFTYNNRMAWGITAEKDPGEPFFKGVNKKGFDYYSGFFQLKNTGIMKNLVLGDYEPRFGQGLTVWAGFNFGKNTEVLLTEKHQNEIRKYSSTNENLFFRGAAATFELGIPEISVFASSKYIDANSINKDSLYLTFKGLDETGLHNTLSEIEDRDAIRETMFGANLSFKGTHFRVGTSFLFFHFNGFFSKGSSPADLYDFTGNSGTKTGVDYKYTYRKLHLFGEMTYEPTHGWAMIHGGTVPLADELMISFIYRNYSRGFFPYYSNGFSEGTHTQNEHGFYMGTVIKPVSKLKISSYIDLFSFPWLRWNTDSPSAGRDFFIKTEFTISKGLQMSGRFQREVKEENSDPIEIMSKTASHLLTRLRYQLSYSVLPSLELRNRVEWVNCRKGDLNDQGILLYQDVLWKPQEWPLDLSFRFAVFDVDSWDTRIYAYENDLLYVFSIPSYYGQGTRSYLLFHTKLNKHLDLWARISTTRFLDRDMNGSGLNTIASSHKTNLKLQARLKF